MRDQTRTSCERLMGTEAKEKEQRPQVVKLDRALKIAESWVNKMSGSTSDDFMNKDFEGRPPRLGLGAKVNKHAEVADFTDPVKRKILTKLGVLNKKPSRDHENSKEAKNSSDAESDDESESRANVFAKKRSAILPSSSPVKKKQK